MNVKGGSYLHKKVRHKGMMANTAKLTRASINKKSLFLLIIMLVGGKGEKKNYFLQEGPVA